MRSSTIDDVTGLLPRLRVPVDSVDGEESGREQLLAVSALREMWCPCSADDSVSAAAVVTMTDPSSVRSETARANEARKLRELIVALDRREPRVQPTGEVVSARTGEGLRDAALRRLDELERSATVSAPPIETP
jgi:hypothetical protein